MRTVSTAAERIAFDEFLFAEAPLVRAYMRQSVHAASPAEIERIERFEAAEEQASTQRPWPVILQRTIAGTWGSASIPPGPKASMASLVVDRSLPWNRVYKPPVEGLWQPLAPEAHGP